VSAALSTTLHSTAARDDTGGASAVKEA